MTREDAIKELKDFKDKSWDGMPEEVIDIAIKALEQESELAQFAKWVASEIFDDDWDEYNKDAFEEIACRKLAKLGLVRANNDYWELVKPQESEVEE